MQLDDIDLLILERLRNQARASWVQVASSLGLSRQTVAERVQRLEEAGVIRGYATLVNPDAVGAALTAFVAVTVDRPERCAGFLAEVERMDEVLECHHIAGDDSYLLKVRTSSTRGLESLITEGFKGIAGVVRTRTTIVLSTSKETPNPPLKGRKPH